MKNEEKKVVAKIVIK